MGQTVWLLHTTEHTKIFLSTYMHNRLKDFVVAFLPSWREPEFLPMPVEGKLIPRNSNFSPGEKIEDPEEIV